MERKSDQPQAVGALFTPRGRISTELPWPLHTMVQPLLRTGVERRGSETEQAQKACDVGRVVSTEWK